MKRLFISLIAVFGLAGLAWGQGDGPSCGQCWTVTDNSCSNQTNCADFGGAETVEFTAPCNANYSFLCKTQCTEPEACHICITCSRVVRVSDGYVVGACTATLDGGGLTCESRCDPSTTVGLSQGVTYRLEVSMKRCSFETESCTPCNTYCVAKARVSGPGASCSAW
jgi:hypothetical protein